MSRGRRYEEPKLNLKKVFAVIIAIIVIIMVVFMIKGILSKGEEKGKIISKSYFVSFKDNKWGVIDESGNNIIDPSYKEMIVIPNSKNDVFICTYDVNYETGEYKTKVLNSKNEEIFTQYEQIEAIQNKDKNDNLWYENSILKVKKDGKQGIINLSGKEIAQCQYDEIIALDGIQNTLKVKKDNKYGIVNVEGKEIIETQYKNIKPLGKDSKSGFIVQGNNEKYGIVDFTNSEILESKYDEITNVYGNDLYVVKQNGKQILVKKDGTEVLSNGFDEIKEILKTPDTGIIIRKDLKQKEQYGVMNMAGELIIQTEYEDIKEAKANMFIAKKNDKYGIVDLQGNTKINFKYNSISYNEKADIYVAEDENFNNDIIDNTFTIKQSGILVNLDEEKEYIEIRQNNENKYYNFKFEEKKSSDIFASNTLFLSKKDGKYGFVDKTGKVVVDYIYDDAIEQNVYGYSAVKKDGKWGSVDNKGNVIQEPTYNLDEYLKIDFIGRWHYGKDINMNYYNQL